MHVVLFYSAECALCTGSMGNVMSALALLVKQEPTADAVLWLNLLKMAMYKGMAGSSLKWCISSAVIDHVRER